MNQFRFSCAVDDLALFVSDGWHSLPPQVWVAICKLTGAKPPQRARTAGTSPGSIKTVDMQQLLQTCPKESQIIHRDFAKLEEFPHVKTGDMLAFHGIRAEALYFQSDHPPLLPPSPVRRRRGREVQGDPGAPWRLALEDYSTQQGSRSPRRPWGPRESRPRLPGGDTDGVPSGGDERGAARPGGAEAGVGRRKHADWAGRRHVGRRGQACHGRGPGGLGRRC